jgi:hypothetical protein
MMDLVPVCSCCQRCGWTLFPEVGEKSLAVPLGMPKIATQNGLAPCSLKYTT